jgi:thiol:disulfide interchange protein DsbC
MPAQNGVIPMKTIVQFVLAGALLLLAGFALFAQDSRAPRTDSETAAVAESDAMNRGAVLDDAALSEKLSRTMAAASQNQLHVVAIRETAMPGLLEVELNTGELLFSDRTGDFLVTGDLFRTSDRGLINLSAEARKLKVVEMIAAVPEEEMIIYRPDEVKASITVFTDADCTFCRKLHGDLEQILDAGIEVRYLAFPRGGPASTVYPKMISIWCSEDRNKVMTQAKNGQNIPERECDNPVLEHFELGNRVGISGTPAVVLEDGSVVPGYLDVERLRALVLAP